MKKRTTLWSCILAVSILTVISGCSVTKLEPISIISGSENKTLEPIIAEFEKEYRTDVEMHYKGSVDIMMGLQSGTRDYDAVWPANSLWIALGDTEKNVKHSKSIMTSPVVFGIKKSVAEQLGWTDKKVYVKDILESIRSETFSFMMTSATQSNSGASAYMGFLYALTGNPDVLTMDHLHSEELKTDIRDLLNGIHRSSGSSGWLKELVLESDYDSMVNYEALIIEANQALISMGREPMYIVYPEDGIVIADSPLGYIDRNNPAKEKTFAKLQEYLLSDTVQDKITQLGRRTGLGEITENAGPDVFNEEWGVNTEKLLSPIKMPAAGIIAEALYLYQTVFRKPSLTVFCLDYSGSMRESGGINDLKNAMRMLLDQEIARKYMIQAGEDDITVILPFSLNIFDMWVAEGNDQEEFDKLYGKIESLRPEGATDIYTPVITALDILSGVDTLSQYMPAIILMTDGESSRGRSYAHLQNAWETYNIDIPVFSIMFGQAVEGQLEQVSDLTRGRVFDGKHDLVATFRKAKGYN